MIPEEGWKGGVYRRLYWVTGRSSRLFVYNPDGNCPLQLGFQAGANGHRREVRLVEEATGRELGRWTVGAHEMTPIGTPPVTLPEGLVALRLEAGPESPMPSPHDDVRPGPFSLHVSSLDFRQVPREVAVKPEPSPTTR
jgi:hypothetical protein